MKIKRLILIFIICITNLYAKQKAVYEPIDNRLNIGDVQNIMLYNFARSTLAQIYPDSLTPINDQLYSLEGFQLGKNRHMCKDERFINEPMSSKCTAFLVAEDIIITAGHCIASSDTCSNETWILDYTKNNYDVKSENIFNCHSIIDRKLDIQNRIDYAIIRINRKIKDRTILTLRKDGQPSKNDELAVIGYPSGLPLKVADGGYATDLTAKNFFTTNLDTFRGNSGSPVFNMTTGLVEGILVQGEEDYEVDYNNNCRRVKRCKAGHCRGEDVTRATIIPQELIK